MFGLFFHPRRSDDGRPVAVRVIAGQHRGETTDAPPVVIARDLFLDPQATLNRAPGSMGNVTTSTARNTVIAACVDRYCRSPVTGYAHRAMVRWSV